VGGLESGPGLGVAEDLHGEVAVVHLHHRAGSHGVRQQPQGAGGGSAPPGGGRQVTQRVVRRKLELNSIANGSRIRSQIFERGNSKSEI